MARLEINAWLGASRQAEFESRLMPMDREEDAEWLPIIVSDHAGNSLRYDDLRDADLVGFSGHDWLKPLEPEH